MGGVIPETGSEKTIADSHFQGCIVELSKSHKQKEEIKEETKVPYPIYKGASPALVVRKSHKQKSTVNRKYNNYSTVLSYCRSAFLKRAYM